MRGLHGNAVREARVAGKPAIGTNSHRRALVVATFAALLMAFVGAFGTAALPLLPRLAYWLIIMETGALIGIGASTGVRGWGRLADQPVTEGAAVSLLIALPLTLVATGTTALFFGPQRLGLTSVAVMFASVFVVTAAITAVTYLTAQRDLPVASRPDMEPQQVASPEPVEEPRPQTFRPRLLDRLPPHLRVGTLIALEAEDHYVRVHTDAGSSLVLLRMGDAVLELDGLAGMRTHRSWWVARGAVTAARRSEGRGELVLTSGAVAPVSRSALPLLTREGWFG